MRVPVTSCTARMFAPHGPMMALMASDPQVTRSLTSAAIFSALTARTAWTPARPSWTALDWFRWNLAPVVSWNFLMVAPPFPMMISGSLPAEILTDFSPAFSSTGSSERGGQCLRLCRWRHPHPVRQRREWQRQGHQLTARPLVWSSWYSPPAIPSPSTRPPSV